ncbi:TIGR03986 family CRISPR-associated RAMP protein [Vallitalea guaymasensis]|uniref:TIGR03986 family type III CRISPR-associated RAMP protein n=1 Tax=Vallitalea guaymasensis TaxID=1185412 RepID=UPI0023541DB6|nr:TIGR03986 family CRISPR-associated RAMP protein [Vallitalea guaymasensis]
MGHKQGNNYRSKQGKIRNLPYNFISFPNEWKYPYDLNQLPSHDKDNGLSGVIEYSFTTESKMTTNFRTNEDNKIYISGSEIRGRIRSNLEILSYSYPEFIYSDGFLYRDFTNNVKKLSTNYKNELGISKNKIDEVVHAGYLCKRNGNYYVVPAKKIGNRYFKTIEEYRLLKMNSLKKDESNYMYCYTNKDNKVEALDGLKRKEKAISEEIKKIRKHLNLEDSEAFNEQLKIIYCKDRNKWKKKEWLEKELDRIFKNYINDDVNGQDYKILKNKYLERSAVKIKIEAIYQHLLKDRNDDNFIPYQKSIKYIYDKGIKEIKTPDSDDQNEDFVSGMLYCSTNASSKRNHYVIGEKEDNIEYEIDNDNSLISKYNKSMESFKLTEGNLDKIKSFYDLFDSLEKEKKEENKFLEKVVFYTIKNNNITGIGRTPYLKIPYKYTINDLLNKHGEPMVDKCSYAEAVFGFTGKGEDNKNAYKSRVRFTNALSDEISRGDKLKFTLPQPKASAFGMYLEQDIYSNDDIMTYNDDSRLRGYKFYHLRKEAENKILEANGTERMITDKEIIDKNIIFEGNIYFNNLSEEELGLLLMSIDVNLLNNYVLKCKNKKNVKKEDFYEQIGGAKPYGYGKVSLKINTVMLKAKNDLLKFSDNPYKIKLANDKINEYVSEFIKKMDEDYIDSDTIKSYLYSKRDNGYVVEDYDDYYNKNDKLDVLKLEDELDNLAKLLNKKWKR